MTAAVSSSSSRILAMKKIKQIARDWKNPANAPTRQYVLWIWARRMRSKQHERCNGCGVRQQRCCLSPVRTRVAIPVQQVDRRSVGGGREGVRRGEELVKIIANAIDQGILR